MIQKLIKRPKSIKSKTLLHYIPNKSVNHIKQSIGIKQITLHTKQITPQSIGIKIMRITNRDNLHISQTNHAH